MFDESFPEAKLLANGGYNPGLGVTAHVLKNASIICPSWCGRADEAVPEPDPDLGPASGNDGARGGAGLTKMQSFVQMKQVSKVREGRGERIGKT